MLALLEAVKRDISIHAPHTGRDGLSLESSTLRLVFQSTRPIRGATSKFVNFADKFLISIHAPHTGRDRIIAWSILSPPVFQSTRPIRGATAKMHNLCSAFLQQQTIKA